MSVRLELDDIQGIVARGYGPLPSARFLMLSVAQPAAARKALARTLPRITPGSARPADVACNIAFTAAGLSGLGMSPSTLAGFSNEYTSGMAEPNRSRVLGDVEASAPQLWRWGGPTSPVHAVVLLWAADPAGLDRLTVAVRSDLVGIGFTELTALDAAELTGREPFGFTDGISQPTVEGLSGAASATRPVRAGEFVLGYPNEYGLLTDRPLVAADGDAADLPLDAGGSDRADLGRNGTYLVFRQLRQDVEAFSRYLDEVTRLPDGTLDHARRTLVAAKMVGRWPSGAPLVRSPDRDDEGYAGDNDFGYFAEDPEGLRCPIGAHIRRANPRDSLDPQPGSARSLAINRRHRILRRGRSYGPVPDDNGGDEVGLYFLGINANLARQFEFLQHTWLNNANFNGLYADPDPLVGARPAAAVFTEQARPVRRRYRDLPQFVSTRGGAYFFLPGITALRYLCRRGA